MSRQYFADVLSEPINAAFSTISATTETVLIPTIFTPIPAMEPRGGKVYELTVGGTCTTGTAGTLIIQPRYGLVIGGTALGVSPTQNYVPSITTAPFIYRAYLAFRQVDATGTAATVICTGKWESGGAVATASSQTSVAHCTTGAAISVNISTAAALWVGMTFSLAPSVIPQWHCWRSFN